MKSQVLSYTKAIQEALLTKFKSKLPEPKPWLHFVIDEAGRAVIYVWDTRQVIFSAKFCPSAIALLQDVQKSYPADNRKPLIGSSVNFEYFNQR
jgi:hypothetical protein